MGQHTTRSHYSTDVMRKHRRHFGYLAIIFVLLEATAALADSSTAPRLDLLLLDAPFNSHGYPSMQQSLRLSTSFYQGGHFIIEDTMRQQSANIRLATIAGFDLLSLWLPPGSGWMHEEWHRAILTRRDIDSDDEIYKLKFSEVTKVSGVRDEDLIYLKTNFPAEMVRLHSAGLEAQTELNRALEHDQFFGFSNSFDTIIVWLNTVNTIGYFHSCTGSRADQLTNETLAKEDASILARDFAGLDCTAWVYDLHRPSEPYAARGIHPSGVGIDRYIKYSNLNDTERTYLDRQRTLSWLNLADPFIYGYRDFPGRNPLSGVPLRWNAALRYLPAPFGYAVDLDIYIDQSSNYRYFTLHNYYANGNYFPGIKLRLPRQNIHFGDKTYSSTVELEFWRQPEGLRFVSTQGRNGGRIMGRIDIPIDQQFSGYFEVEFKSTGWVAGNTDLQTARNFRLGITMQLDKAARTRTITTH